MNDTRIPLVWDTSDSAAWLANPLAETQRHRAALAAQWPADMRIGYFHGQTHLVPADQTFTGGYCEIIPLCGTPHHGMVEMQTVEADPCRICTARYNDGATTGVKPDPFPVGATVEFDTRLRDEPSMMRGVVVDPEPGSRAYDGYRCVQVNAAGLRTNVRVEWLAVVEPVAP